LRPAAATLIIFARVTAALRRRRRTPPASSADAGEETAVPMEPMEAFQTLDLRVGRVTAVEPLAGAKKPAYKLRVDFGPLGVRGSSAQLTDLYPPEDLVGRLVIAVVNLGVRRIAGFASEVLVLGVPDEEGRVVLLSAERPVPTGGRVF
jgi:tRNA-binding protein